MTADPTTLYTGDWLELRREGTWEYVHRVRGHRVVMIVTLGWPGRQLPVAPLASPYRRDLGWGHDRSTHHDAHPPHR
jgi:hypothetical protein